MSRGPRGQGSIVASTELNPEMRWQTRSERPLIVTFLP